MSSGNGPGMISDSVKIARLESRRHQVDALVGILTHPVYSVLAAFILIEYLQVTKINGHPLMGSISGTALEFAFITEGAISALSKSGVVDSLTSLLPLLAK